MELYIGGKSQGKAEYVLKNTGYSEIFNEHNYVNLIENKINNKKIIINHIHLIIREMVYENRNEEYIWNFFDRIISDNPDAVIISDEIGNGIVPIDRMERIYRDITGHILVKLAEKADSVIRIICGIAMVIK